MTVVPRIRSLKPEFFHDRKLARTTSRDARMLYMGLWGLADEWARCNGDSQFLKGQVFPYEDGIDVDGLVDELVKAGRVVRYYHDDDPYLFLPKLEKHQRLEPAKSASRLPPPPDPSEPIQDRPADPPGKSAQDSDPPGEDALLYVAGSKGQVAGSKEQVVAETPRRDDVEQLCDLLRERMIANGCKAPTITEQWRTSARLLLDKDEKPLSEAISVLEWSQSDEFWRGNIHSLPTFRDKYDRLRLASQRAGPQRPSNNFDAHRALADQLRNPQLAIGGNQ